MSPVRPNIHALVSAFIASGCRYAVLCPGSRNALLIHALAGHPGITCISAVDERSAAFVAAGLALKNNKPAIICCTSGSAVLNLYPAVAEAFYMQVPMLVLTADRPAELIDRWDGQAIHQYGVFSPHILRSYEFDPQSHAMNPDKAIRLGEEIVRRCLALRNGPVHLNVPLREPLYDHLQETCPYPELQEKDVTETLPDKDLRLPDLSTYRKVLVLNGAGRSNDMLHPVFDSLKAAGAVVLSDVISGKHAASSVHNWENILLCTSDELKKELMPDLLITTGKMLLNKSLHKLLRKYKPSLHLHVSATGAYPDPFFSSPVVVQADEADLLKKAAQGFGPNTTEYKEAWEQASHKLQAAEDKMHPAPWNEMQAMGMLLQALGGNDELVLHVSNSMPVRLLALHAGSLGKRWSVHANRGVSGIDGCTSTAVGSALADERRHVLVTGDLAFLYDINAFMTAPFPNNLDIVVFNNRGGGIFGNIDGPEKMGEHIRYMQTPHQTDVLAMVPETAGFEKLRAANREEFAGALKRFSVPGVQTILEVQTDAQINAKQFKSYKKINI